MNTKTEGMFAIIAALIILFSIMLSPIISVVVTIIALVGFGIYKFVHKEK